MMSASNARREHRRRLRRVAIGLVLLWGVGIALAVSVATGRFGDLGMPTDSEGRPRGLLVIGVAVAAAALAVAVLYRRVSGPAGDLLHAAERISAGELHDVDVAVRGPSELRLLAAAFNEMASRLAASQEQRRRFLADITHELRNPLAILQSEIEAQLDGVRPRTDEQLASLLDEAHRLGHLIDDLHTLALSEAGQLVLTVEAVHVGQLVADVVPRHTAVAARRGVSLSTVVAPDLPKVWIDPVRIRQVLDNLLANAIRHSPTGTEVGVTVASSGDAILCRITDAGPGFPECDLETVFDRFTKSADSGGSGLGLSIARDLVVAHGGTIEAHNNRGRCGAEVSFTLPGGHR
ncbi:sensor histidine kinase [Desertimonas flava]|uniref:sensor histidine kinase n=1 Tax=Desertimonas flava TaxID=2064846 RepID=UPI000E34F784|nr:HAMP domain-containing sensor histidine kinase [Desertimonas flava]